MRLTAPAPTGISPSLLEGARLVCFAPGRYVGRLVLGEPGQAWRLAAGAVIAGSVEIRGAGASLEGGTVEGTGDDPWSLTIAVTADDVTVQRVSVRGGGIGIAVLGRDRVTIRDSDFADLRGSAIFLWGEGRGADDVTIEDNRIVQTLTRRASPIASRGSEDGSVDNLGLVVRGNTIDQGDADAGWFGIELKHTPGALVEANTVRGGATLVSLPDSDGVVVRDNLLDLRGSAYWGIEIASSDRVLVEGNRFVGGWPDEFESAVSMNSGPVGTVIRGNTATSIAVLVDLSGDRTTIADNCLDAVGLIVDHVLAAGDELALRANEACAAAGG